MLSYHRTRRWIDHLQDVIARYNAAKHSKIRCAPNDVNKHNEMFVYDMFYRQNPANRGIVKFSPGDFVRISKYKTIFEKSYTRQWTIEIFRVKKVLNTYPVTYSLVDLNNEEIMGGFYNQELQKANYPNTYLVEEIVKRRGDKYFVKYLGEAKGRWVKKTDLLD